MQLSRKLKSPSSPHSPADSKVHVATAMSFPTNAGLIFLKDDLTGDNFLVDTGATLSIVPHNSNESPSGPILNGANGKLIPTWGFISKVVQFQGRSFQHFFLQAAVAGPILGIDFLKKFNVTVAPGSNKILFATTHGATCPNRCDKKKPHHGRRTTERNPWHSASKREQQH